MIKIAAITLITLSLSACWNGENVHVRMGDVSFGQQLIDLKRALDEEAISEREYEHAKQRLLDMANLCEDIDEKGKYRHRDRHDKEREEEEDGFNWF